MLCKPSQLLPLLDCVLKVSASQQTALAIAVLVRPVQIVSSCDNSSSR